MQKDTRRLLRLFAEKHRHGLVSLVACALGQGLFNICSCLLLASCVDAVFLQKSNLPAIAPALLALFGVLAGREGLALLSKRCASRISFAVRQHVREKLHAARLSMRWQADSQHTLTLALETTEALDDGVRQVLPLLAALACSTPCVLVALFLLDVPTGLLALVTLPIAPLLLWLIGQLTAQRSLAAWQELRTLSASFGELITCLPTLKLFGQAERQGARLATISQRFATASLQVLQLAFASTFALELITTLAIALIAVSVGLRLLYGHIDFRTAFAVLLLAPVFYQPLRASGAAFHAAMTAHTAWQQLRSFLPATGEAPRGHHAQLRTPPAIQLKNLHYRYPGAAADALDLTTTTTKNASAAEGSQARLNGDLTKRLTHVCASQSSFKHGSLLIPAGKITAITGPSGCGKTTLCRLLTALALPTEGEICLEDQPLATMSPASRAKLITYVPQEPHLYNTTLRDNLTLRFAVNAQPIAPPNSQKPLSPSSATTPQPATTPHSQRSTLNTPTDALCRAALQQAGLLDWYRTLPAGLDTRLGEGGTAISNGQRHRLGLARAFLQDRPVVILDEPTAGLDAATEEHVLTALQNFAWHRTLIIVTHRPAVLALADTTLTLTPPQAELVTPSTDISASATNSSLTQQDPFRLTTFEGGMPTGHSALPTGRNTPLTQLSPSPQDSSPSTVSASSKSASSNLNAQRSTFNSLKTLLALLSPVSLLLLLAVSLLALACALGLLSASAWLIASAALHPHLYALALGITAVRACGILRAAARYAERYLTHRTAFHLQTRLHLALYQRAARLLPLRSGPARQGALLHDLLTGCQYLRDFYLRALLPPLTLGLVTLLLTLILYPAIGLSALLLPFCYILHLFLPALRKPGSSNDSSASSYRSALLDLTRGRAELLTAGTATTASQMLNILAIRWQQDVQTTQKRSDHHDTLLALSTHLTLLLLLAALTQATVSGTITGIGLAVWLLLLTTLLAEYPALPAATRHFQTARTAAHRILVPYAAHKPDCTPLEAPLRLTTFGTSPNSPLPTLNSLPSPLLTVTDVTFGYDSTVPILRHLSFTVRPGQHTAILGESGAGKTTLAQLLAGVWSPDSGTITRYAPLTCLPQGSCLFAASLRTNFTYLYPGISDKKILAALTDAQFTLSPTPDSQRSTLNASLLDSPLGPNASHLSGGQRSRLLTALTLASDAPLLLLDEPTAGLDSATAAHLLATLFTRLARTHQTLLLITHDSRPLTYCQQAIHL